MTWYIVELEAVGDIGESPSLLDLMNKIEIEKIPHELSWIELVELAGHFEQVINGVFVGFSGDHAISNRGRDVEHLAKASTLLIESFDSMYWRVFANDKTVIEGLANMFSDTEFKTFEEPVAKALPS